MCCGAAVDKAMKNTPVSERTRESPKDAKIAGAASEDEDKGSALTVELTGATVGAMLAMNLILIATPKLTTVSKICNMTAPGPYL